MFSLELDVVSVSRKNKIHIVPCTIRDIYCALVIGLVVATSAPFLFFSHKKKWNSNFTLDARVFLRLTKVRCNMHLNAVDDFLISILLVSEKNRRGIFKFETNKITVVYALFLINSFCDCL